MSLLNVQNTATILPKTEVNIPQYDTDGATQGKETWWQNDKWTKYFGYWRTQPDLQTAVILKTYWTCGLGYTCDQPTENLLNNVVGWGKDTFLNILMNMDMVRNLAGDAFAHIVWENPGQFEGRGRILNIKPLNPGSVRIVVDVEGMLIRYEQFNINTKEIIKEFKPWEMFHITCNRIADEIHGTSRAEALGDTIRADYESFKDITAFAHNQAIGLLLWKIKTDKSAEINAFKTKVREARNEGGSDLVIPDDDKAVDHDSIELSPSNFLLDWRAETRNRFYRAIMLPQIMPGAGGQGTESDGKVIYFGFEQIVKTDQTLLEKDIKAQLGLTLKLYKPASIQPQMGTDASKDGAQSALNFQSNDTQAGVGQ